MDSARRTDLLRICASVWLLVACLGSSLSAQGVRARINPLWIQTRDFMRNLESEARRAGHTISSDIKTQFRTVSTNRERLQKLAISYDTKEAWLTARDQVLIREHGELTGAIDNAKREQDDERQRLQQQIDARKRPIEAEANALRAWRPTTEAGIRQWNARKQALDRAIAEFSSWGAQLDSQFKSKWAARWNELNGTRDRYETRRKQLVHEYELFNNEVAREYDPPVLAWEGDLKRLISMIGHERESIRAACAKAGRPAPELRTTVSKVVDELKPQAIVERTKSAVRSAQNLTVTLQKNPSATIKLVDTVTGVTALVAKKAVPPAIQVTLLGAKGVTAGLEGADRASRRIDDETTSRLRRSFPAALSKSPLVRQLARENQNLQARVATGEITEAEKRRLIDERTRRLLSQQPPVSDAKEMLIRSLFSKETGKGLQEFAVSELTSKLLAHHHKQKLERILPGSMRDEVTIDNVSGLLGGLESELAGSVIKHEKETGR